MKIIKSISEASEYCSQLKNKGKTIATINTGGDLHEGHMHLVSMAKDSADIVIVMIDFPYEYFNLSEQDFYRLSKNYKENIYKKDIHQTMSMIGIINALNFSVKPLIAPIIRENDGIPFSSRNKELSKGQRKRASYICERIQKISEWESYTSAEEIKKYLTDVVKNSRAKLYSLNVYDFKTGKNMDIIDREVIIVIGILFNEIYIEDNIRILPK